MSPHDVLSSVNHVRPGRTRMRDYDLLLVAVIGTLLIISLVMVYSASIALSDGPKFSSISQYRFLKMQAIYVAIGLGAIYVVCNISMELCEQYCSWIFVLALLLLVVVLIPPFGHQINGAWRWISLGFFNFQPSEFMKVTIILFTANYVVRKQDHMGSFQRGVLPIFLVLAVVLLLVLKEPDLGAAMVISSICLGILFLGGLSSKYFIGMLVLGLSMFVTMILVTPWRLQRVLAFTNPFSDEYAKSSGYQLIHSLLAIGRGEWFGVGLGFSIEKLHYLPEAHTDFIMAVIGEELGFVGMFFVMALYVIIVIRGFKIGRQAIIMERVFNGLIAQGIAIWFGVQSFINLGVCLGLLPTKGLTLPLVSYGGSAIVMSLIAVGILFRVDFETRRMMRGQPIS